MKSNHEIHAYVRILYYKGDMVNTKQKTKKKNTKKQTHLELFFCIKTAVIFHHCDIW